MSIRIDPKLCIGCGRCVEVCPGNLIKLGAGHRALIRHPQECWACTSCLKECPVQAIGLYLGADLGGAGSVMTVKIKGKISRWICTAPDGSQKVIEINSADSNKY